jgi:hypothetical protein
MEEAGEASHRGCQSQQIPREEITPISSERRRLTKSLGGCKRGSSSEGFAQGGVDDGCRRWPERPGDGGGDTDRQRGDRGERERRPGLGWVSLTDPDSSQLG